MGESYAQPLLDDEEKAEISSQDEIRIDIKPSIPLEWCNEWRFTSEDMPPLPSISTVDPFQNNTYHLRPWEALKMIICIPILVVRVLLVALILCLGYLCTKTALLGWKDNDKPMPRWRRNIMFGTRLCARGILFCYGLAVPTRIYPGRENLNPRKVLDVKLASIHPYFHWIERKGKPAPREVAPIVVSNHVSFIDPIYYFYEHFATNVSSISHNDRMFVGTIIRSMQVIMVDRSSPDSKRDAFSEIKSRAGCNEFPRVLLFPEGTTTNGRALISFKKGAFSGFPIQPVVVKYPHVHFDISWGSISLFWLLPRMLLQFHNFMQVHYLPVIYPSAWERNNPTDFAERVKSSMARALNVPTTEHSLEDSMICERASQLKMPASTSYVLEMGKLKRQIGLTTDDALYYLEKFARINSTRSGMLTKAEFLHNMGISYSQFSDEIFRFFDRHDRGSINFQEFVLASADLSRQQQFIRLLESTLSRLELNENDLPAVEEIEPKLRPKFSEEVSKRLAGLVAFDGVGIKRQLSRNPELVFPFALALTVN